MPNITVYASEEDYKLWLTARRVLPSASKAVLDALRRELPRLIEEEKKKFDLPA